MLPIILNTLNHSIALVGNGRRALSRLQAFDQGGLEQVTVFSDAAEPELTALAGHRLVEGLPTSEDLEAVSLVFIADVPKGAAEAIANCARGAGCLVHVEDDVSLCDFHMPAILRRGDLILTASTNGRTPGLARRIRLTLETLFGPEWAERVTELSEARRCWQVEGRSQQQVSELTERLIAEKGWL